VVAAVAASSRLPRAFSSRPTSEFHDDVPGATQNGEPASTNGATWVVKSAARASTPIVSSSSRTDGGISGVGASGAS
jgi:hypothetical protein